jgi:hypothetical protein
MASRNYPTDILEQATEVLAACKQIDPDLHAGAITQNALADALTQARDWQGEIAALEAQLTTLRNRRKERLEEMWDGIKRMRATVKGIYGDNSAEYALLGCTRISERRRPTRRSPA